MIYRKPCHRIFLCLVLSIAMGGTTMLARAMTPVSPAIGASASVSGERQLRGEFIRLSEDRVLVSSVGAFDVPATAKVIDQREDGNELSAQKPQVSLKFRNDYLIEVTIY